jgi:hypothetical protein
MEKNRIRDPQYVSAVSMVPSYICRSRKVDCLVRIRCGQIVSRAGIFKLLRSPGIDSKEPILPAFVAWRSGGLTILFLLGS